MKNLGLMGSMHEKEHGKMKGPPMKLPTKRRLAHRPQKIHRTVGLLRRAY